jgi:Cdc6-like AAA superfamily ATPase
LPLGKQKFGVHRFGVSSKGSVLFIDEAYSLLDDREGLYGDEAISTLVQEMENRRNDTVIILAGYPDKMEKLLERDPGLRSRIAFHVNFPDYSQNELLEIMKLMANQNKLTLSYDAIEMASRIFAVAEKTPDFGNGRFVRNMLEKALMHRATDFLEENSSVPDCKACLELTACDFEEIEVPSMKKTPHIGFSI